MGIHDGGREVREQRHRFCVVFDLDDTLYDEIDYVASGFGAVVRLVEAGSRERAFMFLKSRLEERRLLGSFQALASELGYGSDIVAEWVLAYRAHAPSIGLRAGMSGVIEWLESNGVALACVTDGRSVAQRLKMKALGVINKFAHISISEEIGAEKPSPVQFLSVVSALPGFSYCYVADNPAKDFVAPRSLGWFTVGIGNERSLRAVDRTLVPASFEPDVWCHSVSELRGAIDGWFARSPLSRDLRGSHASSLMPPSFHQDSAASMHPAKIDD